MGSSVQAFIAFLKTEATQAEQRAKSLRATAATIEAKSLKKKNDVAGEEATNTTTTTSTTNISNKKRRKTGVPFAAAATADAGTVTGNHNHNSNRTTAAKLNQQHRGIHTAYTLFLHECFEIVQKSHPRLSTRELIVLMNRQWHNINPEEKRLWKSRAEQMKEQNMNPLIMAEIDNNDNNSSDDHDDDDEGDGSGDNNISKKQRTTLSGGRKVYSGSTKKED